MNGRLERWRKGVRKQKNGPDGALPDDPITPRHPTKDAATFIVQRTTIFEQSTARTVGEQQENRTCGWSRQPLTIEQLRRPPR